MPDTKEPKDESFKVIDRRLFNADGEVRDEVVRAERLKEDLKPAPPAVPAPPAAAASAPASAILEPKADAPRADAAKPSRGFQMLINFVAQNAAMLLGAYPDPAQRRAHPRPGRRA